MSLLRDGDLRIKGRDMASFFGPPPTKIAPPPTIKIGAVPQITGFNVAPRTGSGYGSGMSFGTSSRYATRPAVPAPIASLPTGTTARPPAPTAPVAPVASQVQQPVVAPAAPVPQQEVAAVGQYEQMIAASQALAQQQTQQLASAQQQREAVAQQYGQRENELTQYLENLGQSERTELDRRRQQMLAQQQQALLQRGLTSTTAYDAAMRGIERGSMQDLLALEEKLTRQKMDYLSALSGETLGAKAAAANAASQTAMQQFEVGQAPLQARGALAGYYGDVSKLAREVGSREKIARMEAEKARQLQAQQLAFEQQKANQQAELERLGLQQQAYLGYGQLQNALTLQRMQQESQLREFGLKSSTSGRRQPGQLFGNAMSAWG